ncbi:MAG: GMP synthase (glutamine-hydrolyzing), partial [Candidatus Latescibacteria bacterium]|nr:GMP synthase (glutamine-hydrolyzing) [Candidatus Latescibacterota bacterium]
MTQREWIAILDFGSQYTQLIARRIREGRVYCEILPHDISAEDLKSRAPSGVILSGGPESVYGDSVPHPDPDIFEIGLPILGICYGVQLMGHYLEGKVSHGDTREYGHATIEADPAS